MIKSILQTWKEKKNFPLLYKTCQPSWQKNNPDWEYVMYDDNDINLFVKTNFPVYYADFFCKYDKIILKVDIFRCLYYLSSIKQKKNIRSLSMHSAFMNCAKIDSPYYYGQ